MKKIMIFMMIIVLSLCIAIPVSAFNGSTVIPSVASIPDYSFVKRIFLDSEICTGTLKGRIEYSTSSVSYIVLTPVVSKHDMEQRTELMSWVIQNKIYEQSFNSPGSFSIDLSLYLDSPGNYNLWLTDGLGVVAQSSFVYAPGTPYLKQIDTSDIYWFVNGVLTTTRIADYVRVPLTSVDVLFGCSFRYTPQSNSYILVKLKGLYYLSSSYASPVSVRRTYGPGTMYASLYNVNRSDLNNPYYFIFDTSKSGVYDFAFYSYSATTAGTFATNGVELYELQTEDQRQTQVMVDALNDPSFGSTDQSGSALNNASKDTSDFLQGGSSKEDQLFSDAVKGSDTSQFDGAIKDTNLLAGLKFWREFFEFSYAQLDFYKVILGLCVSVGTIALVLGISGRLKKHLRKGDDDK